jgi:surface antigen
MPQETATNRGYRQNLGSFIVYASSFIDGENRKQRIDNSESFQKVNNQVRFLLVGLGLSDMETFEDLNFEESVDILKKYLSSIEEDPSGASIPVNLKELVENLNDRDNQKIDQEISRTLQDLRRVTNLKTVLAQSLGQKNFFTDKEDEVASLVLENSSVANKIEQIEKSSLEKDQKEEEIKQVWQEAWNEAVEQTGLKITKDLPVEKIREIASEIKNYLAQKDEVYQIIKKHTPEGVDILTVPKAENTAEKATEIVESILADNELTEMVREIKDSALSQQERTERVRKILPQVFRKAVEDTQTQTLVRVEPTPEQIAKLSDQLLSPEPQKEVLKILTETIISEKTKAPLQTPVDPKEVAEISSVILNDKKLKSEITRILEDEEIPKESKPKEIGQAVKNTILTIEKTDLSLEQVQKVRNLEFSPEESQKLAEEIIKPSPQRRNVEKTVESLIFPKETSPLILSQETEQALLQNITNLVVDDKNLSQQIEEINANPNLSLKEKDERIRKVWNSTWKKAQGITGQETAKEIPISPEEINKIAKVSKEKSKKKEKIKDETVGTIPIFHQNLLINREDVIARNIILKEETLLSIDKTLNNPLLSGREKIETIGKIWSDVWDRAIDQSGLTPKEAVKTKEHVFSTQTVNHFIKELSKPQVDTGIVSGIIKESFKPLTKKQQIAVQQFLLPTVATNRALVSELGWENVFLISFAEIAPILTSEEFNLNSDQALNIIKNYSQVAEKMSPAEQVGKEMSPLTPQLVFWKRHFTPLVNISKPEGNPQGNAWLVKDERGRTIFENVKLGINLGLSPELAFQFQKEAGERLSLHWTTQGINPQEIQKTKDIILKSLEELHESKNYALISDSELVENYSRFQKELPQKKVNTWASNRIKSISNLIKAKPTPFPNKIKTDIKKWFLNTKIGKQIKGVISTFSQNSLQKFFSTTQIGIKKATTAAVFKILTKLGLQAVANTLAPVIGTIIAFAAEKIIKAGVRLVRKVFSSITSGFGLADTLLGNISNQNINKNDDKGIAFLLIGVIGFIVFFPIFVILVILGGAFIGEMNFSNEYIEQARISYATLADYECDNPRHFSEEVICKLSKENYPCNNSLITTHTWINVSSCFSQITLNNKEAISNKFLDHIQRYGKLQCLGFALVIQSSLGQNFDLGHGSAGMYTQSPYPSGYTKIDGSGEPARGDLAVWSGSPGHIALVLGTSGNIKIVVAEADGTSGMIAIKERARPSIFLRYESE